jgi:hypothetical protein
MFKWRVDWGVLIWVLVLSAIFWGGLTCTGANHIEPDSARPSHLERQDNQRK